MSTLKDLEIILINLMKSQISHESQWIEDNEDHTYPWRRHHEDREVIDTQIAKKIKEIHSGEKCRHMVSRFQHLKTDLNLEKMY